MEWFLIIFGIILVFAAIIAYLIWKLKQSKKLYRTKYPYSYLCLDGHKCRSLSEFIIDNFLFRKGIEHKAEDVIVKGGDKKYKYDFYLPDADVYLEFFGYSGKKYYDTKKDKEKFYKKHKLNMIAIEPMDLANIEESLGKKLEKYYKKISRERFCPDCGKKLDLRF